MKESDGLSCNLCNSTQRRTRYDFGEYEVVCCRDCGLLYVRTKEAPPDFKSLYGRQYYQGREDYYYRNPVMNPENSSENQNILDFEEGLDTLATHKDPRQSRLLDVGCALGIFLSLARRRGWETYGIDISEYATDYASRTFGIKTFCGQLTEAAFPDKWFDAITLWDVFEHFPDPSSQLREVHRVLKDDGIVLLDTPNAEALVRRVAHFLYRVSLGRVRYPAGKLHHIFHLYYFSRKTAEQLLRKCGFRVVDVRGKPIPLVKARGNSLERLIVKAFSVLESRLKMEYEIVMLLQKDS